MRGGLVVAMGVATFATMVYAEPAGRPVPAITRAINEADLVTLAGNTRSEARSANDLGAVPDSLAMDHMLLQLKRAPEREAALVQFIEQLHDRQSPDYHQWLTPGQFAQNYGVAKEDLDTVKAWLTSHGFTINGVSSSGLKIDFSGTAGMVRSAFHTDIHNLEVNGVLHLANMSDPKIPSALEPGVAGVVSLHNFLPKPQLAGKAPKHPGFTVAVGSQYPMVPGDLATIYNFNPAFAAGFSGQGQTIMVIEDTDLYSGTDDWTVFRKTFGLTRPYPHGTLTQVQPTYSGGLTCTNPGINSDDSEAAIDVEWATAAAPNAAIVLASCSGGESGLTFGGLKALENVLSGQAGPLPSVISISYGESEADNGATANLAYSNTYQNAVALGVPIFVSSGDDGAAISGTRDGIAVSGFTSTVYNVSVGGTDFGWAPDNVSAGTYWSATNSSTYSSALSYIQEIPWNNTCASGVLAAFVGSTPLNVCKDYPAGDFQSGVGGSGGPSGCATGAATVSGVVSGTCAGWAKPSWQSVYGNPSDGVRDVPDVALFASNGFWGTYYIICYSDPTSGFGGEPCTGPVSGWAGFGGTSVSAPIMAAIQTLINQYTGDTWGNPNTLYYSLARSEYGGSGSGAPACNSNTVNKTSNGCVFYDITQGDNDVNCTANSNGTKYDCYLPGGYTIGVLSTSDSADDPAYQTTAGWDFASGIGSVNVWNLMKAAVPLEPAIKHKAN
jgi:subtilase family serine protease